MVSSTPKFMRQEIYSFTTLVLKNSYDVKAVAEFQSSTALNETTSFSG